MFFLERYFFDEQSKFLEIRLYWNKKVKNRFIYECSLGEKKKKFVVNKVIPGKFCNRLLTEILTEVPISHSLTEVNQRFNR